MKFVCCKSEIVHAEKLGCFTLLVVLLLKSDKCQSQAMRLFSYLVFYTTVFLTASAFNSSPYFLLTVLEVCDFGFLFLL